MDEVIQSMDRYYRDQHGIIVNVIGYDPIGQRVIYRRPNYEWECVAPLIVFRARFKRMDKVSVKLSAYVWDGCAAAGIKGNKLLIMLRLADFASDEGIAYPSVATIARQLGAGRSTVITLLGELEKGGWLTKKERRQGQRNTSNLYTLNVERLRQAAAGAFYHSPDSERPKAERSKVEGSDSERTELVENQGSQGPKTGHDPSVNSKQDPSGKSKPPCPVPAEPDPEVVITDQAIEVLTHLNRISGSRYQKSKTSLENIRARLREGYSVSDMMLVIDLKHEHWHDNDEQYQYMRPETLFGPKKFEGYLQSAVRWEQKGRPLREDWGGERKRDAMKFGPVDKSTPAGFRG